MDISQLTNLQRLGYSCGPLPKALMAHVLSPTDCDEGPHTDMWVHHTDLRFTLTTRLDVYGIGYTKTPLYALFAPSQRYGCPLALSAVTWKETSSIRWRLTSTGAGPHARLGSGGRGNPYAMVYTQGIEQHHVGDGDRYETMFPRNEANFPHEGEGLNGAG